MNESIPHVNTPLADRARLFFESLQGTICTAMENIEGTRLFLTDRWDRTEGGGGITRVLENGSVFEKAGVNTSTVFGMLPEALALKMNVPPSRFLATGISLVIHPLSPMVPTVHANFRYFEKEGGDAWFGGGADLTPYYHNEEDILHFHRTWKQACDSYDVSWYPRFKQWCDEYFVLGHRKETRGVGGIFFDYLRDDRERTFQFIQTLGTAFLPAYQPIVQRRMNEPWGDRERSWQLLRRGRYAEFNLVYDRGTVFGLETNGRVESILMSLPPVVEWKYNIQLEAGSREQALVDILKHPRNWIR